MKKFQGDLNYMTLNQIHTGNPSQIVCAGKDCPNEGKHPLSILYLNKIGWFCDRCKSELVESELVAEEK